MTEHVPNDLLNAFVDGTVDEHLAVEIAVHLDGCAHCATRASVLEPLSAAFASCDDPEVPEDLAMAVLAELSHEGPRALTEVAVGVGLLLMAAGLAIATQHPVTLLSDVGGVLSASQALVRSVSAGVSPFAMVATVAMVFAGAGALLTVRRARKSL
jgi:anti-sigma factor RsiW